VLGVGRQRELGEDVANVRLDRLDAEPQALGDRAVAEALGDEREDLALAVAELGQAVARGR
jgi:hypothetical protein